MLCVYLPDGEGHALETLCGKLIADVRPLCYNGRIGYSGHLKDATICPECLESGREFKHQYDGETL